METGSLSQPLQQDRVTSQIGRRALGQGMTAHILQEAQMRQRRREGSVSKGTGLLDGQPFEVQKHMLMREGRSQLRRSDWPLHGHHLPVLAAALRRTAAQAK